MTHLIRPEGHTPDDLMLSRRSLAGVGLAGAVFAGYAPAALAAQAAPITTPLDGLVSETVTLSPADGFALPAYLARPQGDGPFPVVLVISEIFGLHAYVTDVCRRLALEGYAAIAPAFFVRVEDPAPLTDMARIQQIVAQAPYEQVMGDVEAALAYIDGRLWADADKIGVTGWCWGGKVVWQACARFARLRAGVACYGRLAPAPNATAEQITAGSPWPVDLAADLRCPVLGLYGEADQGIPVASVRAMQDALARAGKSDSHIELYPDAPHGFHADYRDSYRAGPAADGWARLLRLFAERLKA